MKRITISFCLAVMVSAVTIRAQTKTAQPGPEYNVLNAWTGDWVIQGEAKDTESGPAYKVYWTLKGQRILGGFFLQIHHMWKAQGIIQNGLEITGYDPVKKMCSTYISYDDGSWLISTPTFIDEKTCIETGTTFYPDGRVQRYRYTWNFSSDGKSLSLKGENETAGKWWSQFEAKGIRGPKK
jgi:hypothetical protein